MTIDKQNNWDFHYGNRFRRLGILLGLKGNVVLNGQIGAFISKTASGNGSCIEIGAGSGRLSRFLSRRFEKSYILDQSARALEMARRMSPRSQFIEADIFEFDTTDHFDVVVSVGLAEHFSIEKMCQLVDIQIDLAEKGGGVYIVVPSYSKDRNLLIKTPGMIRNYGYQDAKAEFYIGKHLASKNVMYEKLYIDRIRRNGLANRLLRYTNLVLYRLFRINLELLVSDGWGNYAMFYIKKA